MAGANADDEIGDEGVLSLSRPVGHEDAPPVLAAEGPRVEGLGDASDLVHLDSRKEIQRNSKKEKKSVSKERREGELRELTFSSMALVARSSRPFSTLFTFVLNHHPSQMQR